MGEKATELRVEVAADGTAKVFRQDSSDDRPRPLNDEEIKDVAGGISSWVIHYADGCNYQMGIQPSFNAALAEANAHHSSIGHSNTLA